MLDDLLLTLLAGTTLAACGGLASTTSGVDDASVDRTTRWPSDAGVDDARSADEEASVVPSDAEDGPTIFPGCPAEAPTLGDPCTSEDEVCEYGPSWWVACNTVVKCKAGSWQKDPFSTDAPCDEGEPADGGPCPATWDEAKAIEAGILCPAADCQYPEGYCECLSHCGGSGRRPDGLMGSWRCQPATAECPAPRPLLGTVCDEHDAGTCVYAWPCGCGQNETCSDGVWQGYPSPPCP